MIRIAKTYAGDMIGIAKTYAGDIAAIAKTQVHRAKAGGIWPVFKPAAGDLCRIGEK